jgi:hypothetical protein
VQAAEQLARGVDGLVLAWEDGSPTVTLTVYADVIPEDNTSTVDVFAKVVWGSMTRKTQRPRSLRAVPPPRSTSGEDGWLTEQLELSRRGERLNEAMTLLVAGRRWDRIPSWDELFDGLPTSSKDRLRMILPDLPPEVRAEIGRRLSGMDAR